jgi:signal transduction histidine kinase
VISWPSALWRASGPTPHPSRWAWIADAILAVTLAAVTVEATRRGAGHTIVDVKVTPVGVIPRPPFPPVRDESVQTGQLVVAGLSGVPLAFRRRLPLAAFCLVLLMTLLLHRHDYSLQNGVEAATVATFLSCLIAAYSAAVHSPYRRLTVVTLAVGGVLLAVQSSTNVPRLTPGFVAVIALLLLVLAVNTMLSWQQRMRAMQAEHEAATRKAVDDERSRLARELHDVITHNVSMMVVQAGAARQVLDTAPDRARDALLAVEAGGRAAMGELRHTMGLLTGSDDAFELAPQPGIDQLSALAERVSSTGVPVELTVTGAPATVPAGVDLAAYRVVQEAVTNAVKHAAGAHVHIAVDYAPEVIRVEITDTGGSPTTSAGTGSGRGLIGLRERLAVYGGTLQAGIRPTGGYRVCAEIPIDQT